MNISAEALEILGKAERKNIMAFPVMSNSEYDEIKYLVESAGGHWSEKHRGFVIHVPMNVFSRKLKEAMTKGSIDMSKFQKFQIESQFYPTPDWLAEKMVKLCEIRASDIVLEPSAGRGSIVAEVNKYCNNVIAIEPYEENYIYLDKLRCGVLPVKFEDAVSSGAIPGYNKVVMNPPFSEARDLTHTMLAYENMDVGGHLVGLISENALYYNRQITEYFNTFLRQVGGRVIPVKQRAFRKSGTNVDVVIIDIIKK